jgi:hypothetical protein
VILSVLAQVEALPARPIHAKVGEICLLELGHVKVEEYRID